MLPGLEINLCKVRPQEAHFVMPFVVLTPEIKHLPTVTFPSSSGVTLDALNNSYIYMQRVNEVIGCLVGCVLIQLPGLFYLISRSSCWVSKVL